MKDLFYPMFKTVHALFPGKKGRIFLCLLLLIIPSLKIKAQEVSPAFKITGAFKMEVFPGSVVQRGVEYDPNSSNHLFISHLGAKGILLEKAQYLFKGKKFNLADFQDYLLKKELLQDGIHKIFSKEQVLTAEMIYKDDILLEQTYFYPDGKKQMSFAGDEKMLNGEFTMWHPNGQMSFLGHYKNNLKDGEFESFDKEGKQDRKGTYKMGKLIIGEPVVQDLIYDTPEVPAKYNGNDSILNMILIKKSANLVDVVTLDSTDFKVLDLKFTIYKTGLIKKVDIINSSAPLYAEIIQTVFSKQFMNFQPAFIEGVPVSSFFNKSFYLSNKGLQAIYQNKDSLNENGNNSIDEGVYTITEEMPEFPGGENGLRLFLARTIKYPLKAAEAGIMGKPLVSFIIREDGRIVNSAIVQSAHPLLDAEALRVVQSMPRWKPGRIKGKAVKVKFTIPINFVLD